MFNSRKPNKLVNRNHERSLHEQCIMMQEASKFKGFYDLVKVSVFATTISNLNYRRVQNNLKYRIVNNIYPPILF